MGIISVFPGLGRESCLSRVLVIPCFNDISFVFLRWVKIIGVQIGESGSFRAFLQELLHGFLGECCTARVEERLGERFVFLRRALFPDCSGLPCRVWG